MATYPPPLKDEPIFNVFNFRFEDLPLTIGDANNLYVRFPNFQSNLLNLTTTNFFGISTFNSDAIFNNNVSFNGTLTITGTLTLNGLTMNGNINLNNQNITNGNQITAIQFNGNLNGNASTATNATNATNAINASNVGVTATNNNVTFYPSFVSSISGNNNIFVDNDLTYNPSSNTLSTTIITGTTKVITPLIENTGNINISPTIDTLINSNVGVGCTPVSVYRMDIRNLTTNDTRVMINDCGLCNTNTNASLNIFIRENQTKEHIHLRRAFQAGPNIQIKDFGIALDINGSLTMGKYDSNDVYEELIYINENHTIEVDGSQGGDFIITGTPNITLSGVESSKYDKTGGLISGNVTIDGDLDMDSNDILNVNTITANTFVGTITDATNTLNVDIGTDTTNNSRYITFTDGNSGNRQIRVNNSLRYNPSTNTITATLNGNASTATTATNATNINALADNSTNATRYIAFTSDATGNTRVRTDTDLTYNPSTNTITASVFNGNVTGNVVGNATTATTATNALNVATTATNTTSGTYFPTFVGSSSSGNQIVRTDNDLTYNPNTNVLTAVTFNGNLTGNVTGQVSSISNFTTTDLTEGTNLYYTDTRVRLALSGGTGVTYNNTNGEISIGQSVGTTDNVIFNQVTSNLVGNVTGDLTGNVTGDLVGNVTGDLTGNVTGDLTGNVTGDLTGNVTGDLTGNVTGDLTGNVTGDVTGNLNLNTTKVIDTGISGIVIDATELSYLDGVTSNIQNQINSIAGTSFTPNRAIVSDGSGDLIASSVTDSELGFLSGVSSTLVETTKDQNIGGNKTFTSRVEQHLNGYESVSGYYGLAKDAQPIVSKAVADKAVSTWNTRTITSNSWESVCWSPELGLFCAVSDTGSNNRVATSPNGITWTTRSTSGIDNNWKSVCWSRELGLFVAVAYSGTGNRVMTSSDGITWVGQTSAADVNWYSVCWAAELGLFCAVGFGSITTPHIPSIMTSTDGLTWVSQTPPADDACWGNVTWSPELKLFCAVSILTSGGGEYVMTSPDGVVWTTRVAAANNEWTSITWSPELGLFCAVSTSGTNRVMTSPNGVVWTARSAPSQQWYSVCWSPELGLFCAVANTGSGNRVMTSFNGINWVSRSSASDLAWGSVTWSPELSIFCSVAFSGTGNRVMTSNFNGRLPTSDNVFSVIGNNLTASRALVSDTSGRITTSTITTTELGGLNNKPFVYLAPSSTALSVPLIQTGSGDTSNADPISRQDTITFPIAYTTTPIITCTIRNAVGMIWIVSKSSTQFTVQTVNGNNSGADRVFDWIAIGR
jgi:hypothetical protein